MSVRRIALETLISVTEEGAYANLALKSAAARVASSEVRFLYALVYNALEHRAYVEYLLSHYAKRQKRAVRNLLLLSVSELLFLNTPTHAVIHSAVELCKSIGKRDSCGLINAILRRLDRERNDLPPLPGDPVLRLSILTGYPQFLLREWVDLYGIDFTEAFVTHPPLGTQVRAQHPCTTERLLSALPVPAVRGNVDPNCLHLSAGMDVESLPEFLNGQLAVQTEGAMCICRALGAQKGDRILDACAAPGGKTAYLASLLENEAELVAWELHPHRKELLDATLRRLNVCATTAVTDATVFREEYAESFDRVLLDVPCSGFGLLSDKPDLRYRKTESDIMEIVRVQTAILEACHRYVRQGGTLVYATCTISRRENEDQVQRFLKEHSEFILESEKQYFPHTDGVDGFYHATMKRL